MLKSKTIDSARTLRQQESVGAAAKSSTAGSRTHYTTLLIYEARRRGARPGGARTTNTTLQLAFTIPFPQHHLRTAKSTHIKENEEAKRIQPAYDADFQNVSPGLQHVVQSTKIVCQFFKNSFVNKVSTVCTIFYNLPSRAFFQNYKMTAIQMKYIL